MEITTDIARLLLKLVFFLYYYCFREDLLNLRENEKLRCKLNNKDKGPVVLLYPAFFFLLLLLGVLW